MDLHAASPASPAAAKRAAIIERYGLGRVPPIPVPLLEEIKADAAVKVPATDDCPAAARPISLEKHGTACQFPGMAAQSSTEQRLQSCAPPAAAMRCAPYGSRSLTALAVH